MLNQFLIYFTASIFFILIAVGVFFAYKKPEKLSDYLKFAVGAATGFAVAAGGIMLFLNISETKEDGYFNPELFYPLFALLLYVVAAVAAGTFIAVKKRKYLKVYAASASVIALVYILLLIFLDPLKSYAETSYSAGKQAGLAVSTIIAVAILIVLPLVFGKKEQNETKALAYAAVCIALGFALSYMRLFKLPQGGSITFASLLPLMIYSYKFGIRKGVTAGVIYGMLQAIQDPWILHPVQFLLDYPLAFGMIGLAGIFKDMDLFKSNILLKFVLGGIAASVLRYACHVVSGIIVFDIYAEEPFSPVQWSFLYNSFVFADIAIALVAGAMMLSAKNVRKVILEQ